MRRSAYQLSAVVWAAIVALVFGGWHASAASIREVLPSVDPLPGPGGCSVDIVNRQPGSYTGDRLNFSYGLAGQSCPGAYYGLIVLNKFDRRQLALFVTSGDGLRSSITFDRPLRFVPTADPQGYARAGSGLCVIAFTELHTSIADVAPNQPANLQDLLLAPTCEPLFLSSPNGGARAFH